MKGKQNSRTVVLHNEAKAVLKEYLEDSKLQGDQKLFPISRMQAGRIIKNATRRARVEGKVTFHSTRKTFAKKVYYALKKDLVSTQKALGHKSINSTVSYLSFDQEAIDDAIKGA
jgi:integrase